MSDEERIKKATKAIQKVLTKYKLEIAVDFQYIQGQSQYKIYLKNGNNNND